MCGHIYDGGIFFPLLQEFTERTYFNQNWMNTLPLEMWESIFKDFWPRDGE